MRVRLSFVPLSSKSTILIELNGAYAIASAKYYNYTLPVIHSTRPYLNYFKNILIFKIFASLGIYNTVFSFYKINLKYKKNTDT